jgi:hypothetical protein
MRDSVDPEFNYGLTNFDNIMNSFISVYQCMTLEGWVDILKFAIDSHNLFYTNLVFVLIIIVTHYVFLNMTVAVMAYNLSKLKEEE